MGKTLHYGNTFLYVFIKILNLNTFIGGIKYAIMGREVQKIWGF